MVAASTRAEKVAARDRYHMRLYSVAGRPRLLELIASLRKETARAALQGGMTHAVILAETKVAGTPGTDSGKGSDASNTPRT